MTEARHPVPREKNSFGLLFRGVVTGCNIILPALLIAHGSSVIWQLLASAAIAAGLWRIGIFCAELRQFSGKLTIRTLFSVIWLAAVLCARTYFSERYLAAGAVQLLALTAFAVQTAIGAVAAYRNKESSKGRYIARMAVYVLVFFFRQYRTELVVQMRRQAVRRALCGVA